MRVLIACEESQAVCKAFRELGHEAYSCDVQECSGGHPEWHILGDALKSIEGGQITTMDGQTHDVGKWDLLIAHPPCTYLTVTGNRWFNVIRYGEAAQKRWDSRCHAIVFFLMFAFAECERIAIENPVGCMSRYFRKPDQITQPYDFGDPFEKKTCWWLKGLPKLQPTDVVTPPPRQVLSSGKTMPRWYSNCGGNRAKARSVTFPGIRKGWNGKNQYVQLATCISYVTHDGGLINAHHEAIGNKALAFVGTSGVQMGWLASQADMLADDWRIVE